MSTCKDCIHEKVCDNLIAHGLPWKDGKYPAEEFCDLFKNKADVVPRAEYEKVVINMNAYGLTAKWLQEDIERLQELNNRQVEDIRLAKADVAREIFEEIEKIRSKEIHKCETLREQENEVLQRKYWEGGYNSLRQLSYWIAELKKKWEGEG